MHVQEDVTSPGAELLAAVSCLTWALRPQLGSFARAVCALNFSDLGAASFLASVSDENSATCCLSSLFYCLKIIISPTPTPDVCLFCLIDYQIIFVFGFLVASVQSCLDIYPSCCVPSLSVDYFGFVRVESGSSFDSVFID